MRQNSLSAIKTKPLHYALSVRELAAMGTSSKARINSRVSYDVPDTSNYLYRKDRYQTNWERNKKGKETYIDLIMSNAKRPGGYVPGPSDYKAD